MHSTLPEKKLFQILRFQITILKMNFTQFITFMPEIFLLNLLILCYVYNLYSYLNEMKNNYPRIFYA